MPLWMIIAYIFGAATAYVLMGIATFWLLMGPIGSRDEEGCAICAVAWPGTWIIWIVIIFPIIGIAKAAKRGAKEIKRQKNRKVTVQVVK